MQVRAQAISLMFKNFPGVALNVAFMIFVMVWVIWDHANNTALVAWAAINLVILLGELMLGIVFLKRNRSYEETLRWGRYYAYLAVVSGLCWGSASHFLFVPNSVELQVFLLACLVALTAASVTFHAYWLESFYAFSIPMFVVVSVQLFLQEGLAYQGLAVLSFAMSITFMQMVHRSQKAVYTAISLSFENLDLVERLQKEKDKAEKASTDKTRFLASASHDLRQPVHALTLFSDALTPEVSGDKGKSLLGSVGRSIDVLNQLLESLLDISKLDANIIKPNLEHFELRPLLESLNAEYAPQAQAKGLVWKFSMEDDQIVYSDPVLLGTILRNLISNAIRYTKTGSVEILCKSQGNEVCVDVNDTGIGIPAEQHKNIFREFYQLTNPERDRSKGLGLGLAIVDRLAKLMNHRIELSSKSDYGSCFSVLLPIGDAKAILSPEAPPPFMGHRDVYGMRIVVIDDEQVIREGMQAVLDRWGCVTTLAGSEEEALARLKGGEPPHVIIADYRLRDGKTGVQAIARLQREFGLDIPALMVTGDTDPDRLSEAQASGHALMHKPVQPAKLRAYLRQVQRRKA